MGKNKKRKRRKRHAPELPPKAGFSAYNPLRNDLDAFLRSLSARERDGFFCDADVGPERRADIWMRQADVGEALVNRYSWAVPDDRAIRILKHFDPIVEIGCGANAYWCRQMSSAGIDVVGYDVDPDLGGSIGRRSSSSPSRQAEFTVRSGGPEVLALEENARRTLFLCYPDENDELVAEGHDDDGIASAATSMGSACLRHYRGDCVVHVGELYSDTTLSMDQAPWGRSSSPEFQQQLAAEFHCVLHASLPGWLHVRDSISVWKRSHTCTIVFAADEEDEVDTNDKEKIAEEVQYRHIPPEERLPTDIAAPYLRHLLNDPESQEDRSSHLGEEAKITATVKYNSDSQSRNGNAESDGNSDYHCPW